MIEILIHNVGKLDLHPNMQLNIISENPLFLQDRLPSAYSIQFEVPPTANNLLILGMPHRVTSNKLHKRLPADLIHFGRLVSRGEILMTGYDNYPKLQFIGSLALSEMGKNLNQLELGQYDYGSFPAEINGFNYSDAWATDYVAAMNTAAETGDPFVVAPMKIKGALWEGDDSANGIKNAATGYINYYNPLHYNLFAGNNTRNHIPVLPTIYLKDVLQAVFGDLLTSNPFDLGDFAKLVLPAFNHQHYSRDNFIKWETTGPLGTPFRMVFVPVVDDYSASPRDLTIKTRSFQQAYPFTSLLKNVLKMFSMTLYQGTTYSIEKNNDIMAMDTVVNWDAIIAGKPVISYESAKDYVFTFGETHSNIIANTVKYSSMLTLFSAAIRSDENTDQLLQDESTGAIYKTNMVTVVVGGVTQKIVRSEIQQSPINVYYAESDRDKYVVSSDVKPINTNITTCWGDENPLEVFHWVVPEIEIKDIKSAPYIMLYRGMADNLGGQAYIPYGEHPQLLNHNYDNAGLKFSDFSLLPSGPDGLIAKFHGKFKEWVEKDKLRVKVSVRLSVQEIRDLNMRHKYHIAGRLFYIEKIEYQLTHYGIGLVEADLIEC
jgi:hypothetical protein